MDFVHSVAINISHSMHVFLSVAHFSRARVCLVVDEEVGARGSAGSGMGSVWFFHHRRRCRCHFSRAIAQKDAVSFPNCKYVKSHDILLYHIYNIHAYTFR